MFVCAKCWCLSYVFSAFGLFSYCLPGLFGSSTSQPVCGSFLALPDRLSVSWSSSHLYKLVIRPLFVLHVPAFCGRSVFLHSPAILWSLFLSALILHSLLLVWMLLSLHLWPAFSHCFTVRSAWFKMCQFQFLVIQICSSVMCLLLGHVLFF